VPDPRLKREGLIRETVFGYRWGVYKWQKRGSNGPSPNGNSPRAKSIGFITSLFRRSVVINGLQRFWAMQYVPSYFDLPEAMKEAPEGPNDLVSRERCLNDGYKQYLMRDVRAVELAIEQADAADIETILRAGGFPVNRSRSGLSADDPDVDLELVFVSPDGIGLRRIDFVLNRTLSERRAETIGSNSTLTIGPGTRASCGIQSRVSR